MDRKLKVLFCFPPGDYAKEGTIYNAKSIIAGIEAALTEHVEEYDLIHSMEEYFTFSEEKRSSYDVNVVQMGGCGLELITEQITNNKNLLWVHSLSAGIDAIVANEAFSKSNVPLTNAKGAYSEILGEFVALGVLYHSKHLENFMERKKNNLWEKEPMMYVKHQHMAIVGYGDIGAACAKVAKMGFGMKVTGIKRNPAQVSDEHRSYCDEIVGNDEYDRVIKEADFVVGVLPKVPGLTDDFFNLESTFSKMKETGVFMNIGRGTTVNEDDLITALKEKKIGGAVLDVFKVEPLPESSELWSLPNVLITPHCADQDAGFLHRSMDIFRQNLEIFRTKSVDQLINLCDKKKGY